MQRRCLDKDPESLTRFVDVCQLHAERLDEPLGVICFFVNGDETLRRLEVVLINREYFLQGARCAIRLAHLGDPKLGDLVQHVETCLIIFCLALVALEQADEFVPIPALSEEDFELIPFTEGDVAFLELLLSSAVVRPQHKELPVSFCSPDVILQTIPSDLSQLR